jgi:hypothetical protein
MPKVKGSLADVSTVYELIEPEVYEFRVDKIETEERDPTKEYPEGQFAYIITNRVDEPGSDHHNKPVKDYIYWFKKGGEVNEYSKINLKRYFEAVVGEERANEEDLDTDELVGGRFQAEVYIESFTRSDGTDGKSNKLKNILPLD